jgi:hypothetical protein
MSQMNLLPEYYVKQRFRDRVDMLCVLLFILVMGGVIVVGIMKERKLRDTEAQYETVSRQFRQSAATLDEFVRLQKQKRDLLNDARQASELEEKLPRSYIVSLITRALPKKASLTVLEIGKTINITADMTRSAKPARGRKTVTRSSDVNPEDDKPKMKMVVKIGGYAHSDADVAEIYTRLKSQPITREVLLQHTQEYKAPDGRLWREFQIDWELKNDVDVLEYLTEEVGVVEQPAERKEAG